MVDEPAGDPDAPSSLVRRAVHGDEHALARIVRLHHVAMTRVCYVVTGDREQAAAAVAAAWPVALERLEALDDPGRLAPWLSAIAVEELLRSGGHEAWGDADLGPGTREALRWPEAREVPDEALARALGRLEADDRALLALRYVSGLRLPELDGLPWKTGPGAAARLADLRARLAAELDLDGSDVADIDAALERRLVAHAAITVHPVDADSAADVARDDVRWRRNYVVSVAIAIAVAVLLMASMYLLAAASPH